MVDRREIGASALASREARRFDTVHTQPTAPLKRFLITFAVVCLAVVVLGRWYAYRQLLADRRAEAAQREAVERALAEVIATDAFAGEGTTFERALRGLASQCDVPLRVDRTGLQASRSPRFRPVYISRGAFPLELVLDRIAEEFRIGWRREGDGILITSAELADQQTKAFTAVYPLPAGAAAGEVVSDDAAELGRLFEMTLEPDSWEEAGGPMVIRPAGGALVVHHRPQIHRRVQSLLSHLQSIPTDARQPYAPQ